MAGRWSLKQFFTPRTEKPCQSDGAVPSTALIEIGDFRIDTVHRIATLRCEALRLTSEEFDVLVFLTSHPQRFVTPRTMLATSWASENLHQTQFLKVLLGLRKKLNALSSGKQYLRTEPWVVYRFDPTSSVTT